MRSVAENFNARESAGLETALNEQPAEQGRVFVTHVCLLFYWKNQSWLTSWVRLLTESDRHCDVV